MFYCSTKGSHPVRPVVPSGRSNLGPAEEWYSLGPIFLYIFSSTSSLCFPLRISIFFLPFYWLCNVFARVHLVVRVQESWAFSCCARKMMSPCDPSLLLFSLLSLSFRSYSLLIVVMKASVLVPLGEQGLFDKYSISSHLVSLLRLLLLSLYLHMNPSILLSWSHVSWVYLC